MYNRTMRRELPCMIDARPDQWLAGEVPADGPAARVKLGLFVSRWDEVPDYPRIGHAHGCLELGIGLSGRILVFYDDAEVDCGPGDPWLSSAWERHGWQVKEPGSSVVFAIIRPELFLDLPAWHPPYLELFALPPHQRAGALDDADRDRFAAIGRDLAREAEGQEPHSSVLARLGVLRTLAELSRLHASKAGTMSPETPQRRVALAQLLPVLRHVHEEPWQHHSAEKAAARCSMSLSSFHRAFRRAMGMSFARFRQRVRLAYAAHLLVDADATVASVASEAGFTDVSHLNRAFRSHYGCTPSQYRDMER